MTQLNREQWDVLSRLLDEALELPFEERAAWLSEQRVQHPELVAELQRLLERYRNLQRTDLPKAYTP